MKIAFATTFDSSDIINWSGTPYHMANAFEQAAGSVERLGNLKRKLSMDFKLKQFWKKIACGQRESPRFNTVAASYYSKQIAEKLQHSDAQVVVSPLINPIAFLECQQPIVLWTDALYASLLGFYPGFTSHSASSVKQGNSITRECLSRCKLAVFSSEWAARSAMEIYGTSKEKVHVVPYGANIDVKHSMSDMQTIIKNRSHSTLKLLFLGKHWQRKGGDIVFAVTKALHAAGQPVELDFVGCHPPEGVDIPPYIRCHGFISKRTPDGVEKITRLLHEAHFMFMPSRAEACAVAFAEANAFGLPCLTSYIGGISTVVKDHVNGMTFGLDAPLSVYCDYIMTIMAKRAAYEELALSAFNEYQTRLNWNVAARTMTQLIQQAL